MRHPIVRMSLTLLFLTGCKQASAPPPGLYDLDFKQAYARLIAADFSEFRSNRQCGVLIHIKLAVRTERMIVWQVISSGTPQLSFTATLKEIDAGHTHVSVAVSPERGSVGEAYDGTRFYSRPAVRQPVKPAIEEQIAAVLQGRSFEFKRLPPAPADSVCLVQRGGLESGLKFGVDDRPR